MRALFCLICTKSFVAQESSWTIDCEMSKKYVSVSGRVSLCFSVFKYCCFGGFHSRVQLYLFWKPACHVIYSTHLQCISIKNVSYALKHSVGGYVAQEIMWPFRRVWLLCRCIALMGNSRITCQVVHNFLWFSCVLYYWSINGLFPSSVCSTTFAKTIFMLCRLWMFIKF